VLSKNFVGIELNWPVLHVRVKSAQVTAIWIGDLHEIDEIVYEYEKKKTFSTIGMCCDIKSNF
jgi:hypothetical protein